MPPKPKITKEMILTAVLKITQEIGFEAVNARSIAERLQCSTRPIFTCYESMEELKAAFLDFAFEYYNRYVGQYEKSKNTEPYLLFPLSYIAFAKEETNLFRLLFISDMDLDMTEANDFYKEFGNEKSECLFADDWCKTGTREKDIFRFIFLFTWYCCLDSNRKIVVRQT